MKTTYPKKFHNPITKVLTYKVRFKGIEVKNCALGDNSSMYLKKVGKPLTSFKNAKFFCHNAFKGNK